MAGYDVHIGSSLIQSVLVLVAMLDCGLLLYSLTFALAGIVLFVASERAEAESSITPLETGDVSYESDRLWGRMNSALHGSATPRIAYRDRVVGVQSAEYLADAQPTPTGDSGLPLIPPPADASAPAPASSANPEGYHDEGGIHTEPQAVTPDLKAHEAEEKKKGKPPVPDLAKGILIATNDGDLTFKPGVRIQPRYMFDSGNDNNDFFIRRFRLKGSGSAYGVAKYGVEMKIDNEGRFAATPAARAENAWLDFPVVDDYAYLRAGLYDLPFSRDALTSDSKILFMDRTLIKEALTSVGMADNTFGLMLHGRPHCGQFEYAFGLFDNDVYERFGTAGTRESDQLMPAGRIVWSLWDPMPALDGYADYQESYLGKGDRLEIGANAAHLSNALDGLTSLDLTAWGVDLFANSGHFTFQTEFDQIIQNIDTGADVFANGWYAQFGYLFDTCKPCTEFVVRYENLDPLTGDTLDWVRVGFNFYIREHNLKVQTDYCIRSHNTLTAPLPGGLGLFDENVFEVQLQLDF